MNSSPYPERWDRRAAGPQASSVAAQSRVAISGVLMYAAAVGLVVLTAYLFIVGASILLPLVMAVFGWHLINAVAARTSRITIGGRTLPSSVRYATAILVLALLTWLAVKLVIRNIGTVVSTAPVYEQNLLNWANYAAGLLGWEELTDVRGLFASLNVTGVVRNLTLTITAMMGSLGTVLVYTVFLLLEQHHFEAKITALFPDPERRALVHRILQRTGREIQNYVWLKTLFSAATSLLSYLVMKAAGLDLAEFWVVLIFALNFIPYIGAFLGVLLPASMALVQFESATTILVMTGLLSVIQFVGGSILEPRIMGTGLNVSPVVMLMSLALWGSMWGIAGMFLAVPVLVVIMIVCSHIEATKPIAVLLSANGELRGD